MELKGLTGNFLGDSITYGAWVSCPENIYHGVLKREAGLKEVRNYGINGTRIAKQLVLETDPESDYFFVDRHSFCERFQEMEDADFVVVFGGTNDYGRSDAPFGIFSDRTPETFYGACHYLFSGLIKKYAGKPIVIMTPLHREDELNPPNNRAQGDTPGTLKEYVQIIREVAEFYSLPVLDLYSSSGMQPMVQEIKELYFPDGLHPNDAGQAVIGRRLKQFLENL